MNHNISRLDRNKFLPACLRLYDRLSIYGCDLIKIACKLLCPLRSLLYEYVPFIFDQLGNCEGLYKEELNDLILAS
jgi:hypothetical protein